jgi:hypothetical protein
MEQHTFSKIGHPTTSPRLSLPLVQGERTLIQVIDWPGNSPDLNPVENAWSWMKKQLSNTNKATNIEEW